MIDPEAILHELLTLDSPLRRESCYGERAIFYNPAGIAPLGVIFASIKDRAVGAAARACEPQDPNLMSALLTEIGRRGNPPSATPGGYDTVISSLPLPVSRNPMSKTESVREYIVVGMSCEHCVLSVTEEVGAVAGVERVEVELASGRMVVIGDASEQAIREAVAEAGYEVGP